MRSSSLGLQRLLASRLWCPQRSIVSSFVRSPSPLLTRTSFSSSSSSASSSSCSLLLERWASSSASSATQPTTTLPLASASLRFLASLNRFTDNNVVNIGSARSTAFAALPSTPLLIHRKCFSSTTDTQDEDEAPSKISPSETEEKVKTKKQKKVSSSGADSSFEGLGLHPSLVSGLAKMKIKTPTEVQSLAMPSIMKKQHVIFASSTGSGKTLAYLLPVMHLLKRQEESLIAQMLKRKKEEKADDPSSETLSTTSEHHSDQQQQRVFVTRPIRPRAIIVAPSRELVAQIGEVAKQLSYDVKLHVRVIGTQSLSRDHQVIKDSHIDILIATPGRLQNFLEEERIFFSDVQYVVLDEADTLFDMSKGFVEEVDKLLVPLLGRHESREKPRFIVTSASLVPHSLAMMKGHIPISFKVIESATLHRPVKGVKQKFVEVKGNNKMELLAETLMKTKAHSTIVFCNSIDCCRAVAHYLTEKGLNVASLHGLIPPEERSENFRRFRDKETKVLVSTDLGSRGLDTRHVDHIVNFDFPDTPADYLHRIGRTARAGGSGAVTSFVTKHDINLAHSIQEANEKGMPIHTISALKDAHETKLPNNKDKRATREKDTPKERSTSKAGSKRDEVGGGVLRDRRRGQKETKKSSGRGAAAASFGRRGAARVQGYKKTFSKQEAREKAEKRKMMEKNRRKKNK
eukprot:TRINITY_DN9335_c0_g1_i1.p1 TRINITY_DN9335_c0_g1~~TRINITY_DN9335_c0_g1_i1.p1  ORF type:complete len:713 (-),score=195.68 TRINITY_DN9335_c0_g1_i1:13-2079(-)